MTFEGGEGSGKSTQVDILAKLLNKKAIPCIKTREPGGSPGAELIRELLVTGDVDRWDGLSETLLILAARRDHIEKTIKPALDSGHVVICDRFSDSTMAYQGVGHGLGRDLIETLESITISSFKPDLTIILDVEFRKGLNRALSRGGDECRFEQMNMQFHSSLRQSFLDIAEGEPDRCKVINADQEIEVITEEITGYVYPLIDNNLTLNSIS